MIGNFWLSSAHIGFAGRFAEYWSVISHFAEYYLEGNSVIGRVISNRGPCWYL